MKKQALNAAFPELTIEEAESTKGGFAILAAVATAYIGMVLFQSFENPKRILDGFLDALS